MANPEIGYAGKVTVALDTAGTAGSFSPVGGSAKGSITAKLATPDVTTVNQAGFVQRAPGIIDADIMVECFYLVGDAGQAILLAAVLARSKVWVNVYRDATRYSQAACYVTEFPTDIDPTNPIKVQIKFAFDGTATVAPATPLTIA
jgi:hypothetical protein